MKYWLITIIFASSFAIAKDDATNIELESYIVGDKEQPAVSYFVPWQGTNGPDNLYWNIEDKNDKTLEIIDREVMVRSINIYNDMDLENSIP